MTNTDRIEKTSVYKAPVDRVWTALTNADEFGTWFGVKFDAPFAPGKTMRGTMTNPKYSHMSLEIVIEKIQPKTLFSYRWHPFAIDPTADYSGEPMTLVEFRLKEVPEGTRLHVVESGFDKIPAARRDEAFRMNDNGWTSQIKNIQRHVEK
jgi:uncharacterized protein YndB with AHSA1/START domain